LSSDLAARALTYEAVGATAPGERRWQAQPAGYRRHDEVVALGRGEATWRAASVAVLEWAVKTRSGFAVEPPSPVRKGADHWLTARVGPLIVREPVRVVAVVDEPSRRGFAYGTLGGHPVSGEEAFVVHRDGDTVLLTLRSLTRAAPGPWRLVFPVLLVAQRWYRRRYRRALRSAPRRRGAA
jgi:uncharacterized protein (UPF0548 family)